MGRVEVFRGSALGLEPPGRLRLLAAPKGGALSGAPVAAASPDRAARRRRAAPTDRERPQRLAALVRR